MFYEIIELLIAIGGLYLFYDKFLITTRPQELKRAYKKCSFNLLAVKIYFIKVTDSNTDMETNSFAGITDNYVIINLEKEWLKCPIMHKEKKIGLVFSQDVVYAIGFTFPWYNFIQYLLESAKLKDN